MEPDWHGCCAEEVQNEAKISMNVFEFSTPMHIFNELFLVMEKLKLAKNMTTLLKVS